ncbi:toll-like receptor Tollo [Neocloeon triangulifer]|uniref:toll-like receptor Tollo n=1 Tax=Neocloeon triangulifer TaxID=2078957 RepID=UPI00286FAB84|nr:toll-like receptor Tollo [Neocloeon triangulifer]
MQLGALVFTVLLGGAIFGVLPASLSKPLRYTAPDECRWVTLEPPPPPPEGTAEDVGGGGSGEQQVALMCRLKTINSELEHTNFSVIQPQHTALLRIECSDALFFQSSLSTDSFRPLVELRELSIEFCKLGSLPSGAFRGLKRLRVLSLRTHNTDWSAMALELAQDAFTELPQLTSLDLSENNMWTMPRGVFCPLTALRSLNLTRNRLREVNHLQFSTKGCGTNLVELDVSNNSLEALPPEVLSNLSTLKRLRLQGNGVSFVADKALMGLVALEELNLADNKVSSLPPELFSDARAVRHVRLENNSISVLAPGLFNGLEQLLVLNLGQNELASEWVNGATFTGLVRLVVLDISHNKLTRLESSIFKDLYSLQILRLENNAIEAIPERCFAALANLHTLVLSHNRLATIEATALAGLRVLSLLSLDSNALRSIHPNAFRNASSLRDLHLNANRLMDSPRALADVRMLSTLDLGENLISSIDNASFGELRELYGLRLTENNLVNVSARALAKLPSLKILNLSKNKISRVEHGAFDSNTNLQAIRLDGNQLTDINRLFDKLPKLVWLNISDNTLAKFDFELVPRGLQWLDLHANRLTELSNHLDLGPLKITTLDASANRLSELAGSAIPDSVELLFLSDNLISKVQAYTFFKKPNLTRVDLFGNKISSLTPNALRITSVPASKSLPEFFLGGNPFQCDCALEWLQRVNVAGARNQPRVADLESLYCSLVYDRGHAYVPLVEASPSQFLCQYETHCFALCHCCDFDACDCEMMCPQNCTCYYDQAWSANVVDCSAGNHTALPTKIPMDATQLYLDGNTFADGLPSHAFIGRKRLRVLYLNGSEIAVLHNRSFNGLKELKILHLESNLITQLKGYEFDGGLSESLQELFLQDNRISAIHEATFSTLKELRILKLDGNQLSSFAAWKLSLLPSLNIVTLGRNPWTCECDFVQDMQPWLAQVEIVKDELNCFNGTEDALLPITEPECANRTEPVVEKEDHPPSTHKTILTQHLDQLPVLAGLALAVLLLLIVVVLVFVYRQELRVMCYSRYGVRLCQKAAAEPAVFDAFVSYSSKDEAWVLEELAPVLERGDPAYRLCLHYRDLPVGAYLADAIVQAVESSRRTIMVLSENFIRSEWCRFEFKSAHHQVLRDRRRRLIVVLLGEIPHRDLDPDIRLYLKTNTYLQWGDKLFWEKLRYALPDVPNNQRRNNNLSAAAAAAPMPLSQRPPSNNSNLHRHNQQQNTTSVAIHI